MTHYAIHADRLAKNYTIRVAQPYRTVREDLVRAVKAPLARLRVGGDKDSKETIWALKDISFTIEQGEVVGIIGNNGAGKSTLLKILSRITAPSSGEVAVRGRVSSLLEVGTGFHPELTGRENVFLNGAILGMTRKEVQQKFDEIIDFAGVERFVDTPVKHYSSGMYMRLAFAIAAHLETDVLLVDEVLAVGDASFQQKCLAKMQDVAGLGRTVLLVSHNMTAVQALCERVIHFANGQLKSDGDAKKVIHEYLALSSLTPETYEQRKVGKSLSIANISISPNPVESGRDLYFQLSLVADSRVRLSEAVLLLYAMEGPRIAIVDFRDTGFPYTMGAGDRLRIEGIVNSIPLVNRHYRVGLYVNTESYVGEIMDLANLTVAPGGVSAHSHYAPEYRGWIEFSGRFTSKLSRANSVVMTTAD